VTLRLKTILAAALMLALAGVSAPVARAVSFRAQVCATSSRSYRRAQNDIAEPVRSKAALAREPSSKLTNKPASKPSLPFDRSLFQRPPPAHYLS